ncbi:MAG: phosphoribosylanthranilate isomerase [Pseudomonadota bacterium]
MSCLAVKICGLTSPEAVAAAVDAGADAVGFVFSPSPRQVSIEQANELAKGLPKGVARVAVMRHPPPDFAAQVVQHFRPDWVQTDQEDFETFAMTPEARALPVLREGAVPDKLPEWFLYEGAASGAGTTVDWDGARALAQRGRLMLAGGLSPDNVAEAVTQVRPWGVDVSSGVESAPGIKDVGLVRRFVEAARAALRDQK